MSPEEIVALLQSTIKEMETDSSVFSNHDLNALATYGHGIGTRARTILRGRNVKMPRRHPMEW